MQEDKIDPICGMVGHIQKYDHWFCSDHCVRVYAEQQGINNESDKTDTEVPNEGNKWIAYLLIAVIVGGGIASRYFGVMLQFMGWFFIVVGGLKLLDLQGFVQGYRNYDLVAMSLKRYGRVYPFLEIALGASLLLGHEITNVLYTILILMIVGAIGVGIKLVKKEKFRCACLGTKINVPLTNLTLVEDILMAVMSVMLLLGV